MMSPRVLIMLSGSMPSSAPRVFSCEGLTVKRKTSASETPKTQNTAFGIEEKMPTIEFVTKYMKSRIPAQPNSASAVESGKRQMPFHSLASMRWLAPMVKQRNIMFL